MCNNMSDVRLSNASPTLERVDARQPDNVRPPVRRNLFGTPDREELRRYLTATVQDDVQGFAERYNFDPVNDIPLSPVNYDWQQDNDAPEFYRRPPHGSQRPRREVELSGQNQPELPGENRQDAAERSERQAGLPQHTGVSRKRPAGDSGPCSSECQSKRSHTDEDDDDDQSKGAGSQAVTAVVEEEEVHSRPDTSTKVQ